MTSPLHQSRLSRTPGSSRANSAFVSPAKQARPLRCGTLVPLQQGARPLLSKPRFQVRPCSALQMSGAQDMLATLGDGDPLHISFDNVSDAECTVIRIEGKDRTDLLMSLTGAFTTAGVAVLSASILTEDGVVTDVFRVQGMEGGKVPESNWDNVRQVILDTTSSSNRSSKPAIYGMVAAAEVRRLRPLSGTLAQNDAAALELAAAEMAQAAADLVTLEREIVSLAKAGADAGTMAQKEVRAPRPPPRWSARWRAWRRCWRRGAPSWLTSSPRPPRPRSSRR